MSIPFFSRFSSTSPKSDSKAKSKSKSQPARREVTTRRLGAFSAESLEGRQLMAAFTPEPAPTNTVHLATAIVAPAQDTGLSAGYSNLKATATSTTELTLSWGGGGGATYNYVCQKVNGQWMEIGYTNDSSNTFKVTGLQPGTTYEFRLGDNGSFSSGGRLAYSSSFTGTTQSNPVSSPRLTGSVNTPSAVDLTWTATAGATKYQIQQQASNGTWSTLGTSTATTAQVQRLTAASTNTFRIAVEKNSVIIAYSNTITALTRPASPTNVVATPISSSQITISWPSVPGAQSYTIAYKTPQSGWMYTSTAANQTQTTFNVTAGTTYTFQVGATNASGTSYSDPVSAATRSTVSIPTTAPANYKVTPTNSNYRSYQLSWSPVANATGYAVYVYTANGWQVYQTTANTYLNINQSAGYRYSFYVAAFNSAGVGPGSNYYTITST